jgi:hypothetical protein
VFWIARSTKNLETDSPVISKRAVRLAPAEVSILYIDLEKIPSRPTREITLRKYADPEDLLRRSMALVFGGDPQS